MPTDFKQLVESWAQEMRDNLEANDKNRDMVDEDAFQRSLYSVDPGDLPEQEPVAAPASEKKKLIPPRLPQKN